MLQDISGRLRSILW